MGQVLSGDADGCTVCCGATTADFKIIPPPNVAARADTSTTGRRGGRYRPRGAPPRRTRIVRAGRRRGGRGMSARDPSERATDATQEEKDEKVEKGASAGLFAATVVTYERPARKSNRAAAPPRPRRGYSVETRRGAAAAATWIFRGDE